MKLLVTLVLLGLSFHSYAFESLDEKQIVRALEEVNQEEFNLIYENVITHLKEAEQDEEFESRFSLRFLSSPKFSLINILIQSGFVVSGYDDLCFFGGWMSKKGGNGKCRVPWDMRRHTGFKNQHSAHVYSKEYNCGGINFRCNPMLFGTSSTGKGQCVKYDPVKNLSARCSAASKNNIDNHLKNLKEDPILREKFAHYLKFLIKECRGSRGATCSVLQGHLKMVYSKAIKSNDKNICKAVVEPLIKAKDFIQVGARIESPPVARRPSDTADELPETGLSSVEEKLFKNYKKLGGDSKAFSHVMCFFKKHQSSSFKGGHGRKLKIKEKCKIIINDYTKSSSQKRLFILNRCTGKVSAMQSSHGVGGGSGSGTNSLANASYISNKPNTNLSPSGFFIMGGWHHTNKLWNPGIKMHGLQKGINDNSYRRGIVFHRAMNSRSGYCGGGLATSDQSSPKLSGGVCGRTHGCIGIPPTNWQVAKDDILGERDGGALLYTYSKNEAAKSASYCGGSNLWQ
ncbi:MAG: hypothetical protein EP326_12910 [Deltaproteobacteria bacterium]|nr:MAG: hypothetical protein EP326_12910 [Deltaproteobacteria bacterium]